MFNDQHEIDRQKLWAQAQRIKAALNKPVPVSIPLPRPEYDPMETHTIPVKAISIPHTNRDHIGGAELDALAATIKQYGLLQPPVVSPHPTKKGAFELIAGERRLKAVIKLGWQKVDARVLQATDDEARAIRLVENLQRVDLTPWEEAAQLSLLCEAGGRVDDIAARVGRSPQWVATRLAFGRLIPELRALVVEQDWPLGHLPLLARVPPEQQPAVLAWIAGEQARGAWTRYDGSIAVAEVPSARELDDFLSERRRLLSAAPWKLDDAGLLPRAGDCSTCPKRSSAQVLLFPELADAAADTCLDDGCWAAKQAALVHVGISKLQAAGKTPVLLSNYSGMTKEVIEVVGPATVEREYAYADCKKSDPEAVPAVIVGGDKAGTVKYVKPIQESRPANGKPAREIDQETGKPEPPSTKERQAVLLQKRQCRAGELWSAKLETLKPKFTGCLDALVLFFGTIDRAEHRNADDWEGFGEHESKLNEDAWEQLRPVFQRRLACLGPMATQAAGIWQEALSQAKALGVVSILQFCWHDATVDVPITKALANAGAIDEMEMPS